MHTAAVGEAQRYVTLGQGNVFITYYVAEYLCHVWDSKSTLIFVPFPSSGFNPFLQRETAVGIVLGSVQKEPSRVLPQQKTIHFLVCAVLVGTTNSAGLSAASLCSDLMAGREGMGLFF